MSSSFSIAKAKETISINRYCQEHLLIYVMHKQSVGDPGNQVRRFMIIAISFRWSNIRSKGIECVEHKVVTGWSDRFTPPPFCPPQTLLNATNNYQARYQNTCTV